MAEGLLTAVVDRSVQHAAHAFGKLNAAAICLAFSTSASAVPLCMQGAVLLQSEVGAIAVASAPCHPGEHHERCSRKHDVGHLLLLPSSYRLGDKKPAMCVTQGARRVYSDFVRPVFLRYQAHIDQYLQHLHDSVVRSYLWKMAEQDMSFGMLCVSIADGTLCAAAPAGH